MMKITVLKDGEEIATREIEEIEEDVEIEVDITSTDKEKDNGNRQPPHNDPRIRGPV
jgi:hypothetical protein